MDNMSAKEILAKRLIELRELDRMTQQELADKIGITRQSLSLYEKAERTINIDVLLNIANVLNVSTDYLLGQSNDIEKDRSLEDISKVIKLPISVVEQLINTSLAESYALSAILQETNVMQLLGHTLLNSMKRELVRNVLFKKFAKENSITIPNNIDVDSWGERCLKFVFGEYTTQYKTAKQDFDNYVDEYCKNHMYSSFQKKDEEFSLFYLCREIFERIDDMVLSFRCPTVFGDYGDIYKFYKNYYEEIINCSDTEEYQKLREEEINFDHYITHRFERTNQEGDENNG